MSFYTHTPLRRRAARVRAAFAQLGANASLLAVLVLAACGGGGDATPKSLTAPVTPPTTPDPGAPITGIISVVPTGLPTGINSRVTISSGGSAHLLVGASSFAGLAPGAWTATADDVTEGGVTYVASPASQVAVVSSGATTVVNVAYVPNSGALTITVSGLPASGVGDFTLTGPASFSRTMGATTTLTALAPGTYHIEARGVKLTGGSFAPTNAQQDVAVVTGNTPATASVTYVSAPSVVNIAVTGLPGGANAAVTLTPPTGSPIAVTASTRLPAALAGRWQMNALPIKYGGFTFTPSPASKDTVVSSGDSLAFNVQYAVSTGALAVAIQGLPTGSSGAVNVTGPGGFLRTLTNTTTITDLAPGVYTVIADSLAINGSMYRVATGSQQVTVVASLSAAGATVSYSNAIATLVVNVTGLPTGATNNVEITGPNGFDQIISGSTTFTNVTPGIYTVVANAIQLPGGVRYDGTPNSSTKTVSFGTTSTVDISYARSGGKLIVTVNGLPGGASAAVALVGTSNTVAITASATLDGLVTGSYNLTALPITFAGTTYGPSNASTPITISSGVTSTATVTYSATIAAPGRVNVSVLGLPGGAIAALNLIGTASSVAITSSTLVDNVAPGNYTLTAAAVTYAGITYNPSTTSIALVVVSGQTMNASVTYTAAPTSGGGMNLTMDGFYLTQATQKMDNSVPLVANRDALIRVFVHANQANTAQPTVRVRVYDGAVLLQTLTLTAPETSVRTALAEGTLTSTWNSVIPAANVRTGMQIVADVDPTNSVTESDKTDNSWPRSGTPQAQTVNVVPTFNIRFVPVTVGALTGNVTAANKDQFLVSTRRMHPVNDIVSDVRAPFTSSTTQLQSGDGNNAWTTVLSEINALRATDGAASTTHYFGVVKVSYNSGVAGYGYVPGRAAVGWDYLPSGDAVAVHELGHNFGRPHTNCGGAANPDLTYPYPNATIGVYGWNSGTGALIPTTYTDVMGYCSNQWTDDWTWTKVMQYRASSGYNAAASVAGANSRTKRDGLLVWGRVVDGRVILEPAFRVSAPPTPAQSAGTHRLLALDARGNTLVDLPFTADRVDHAFDHDERHFAVVVPWSPRLERALATIRVLDVRQPLGAASLTSASTTAAAMSVSAVDSVPVVMPAAVAQITSVSGARKRVEWNRAAYPMVMARDANTGEIMAFMRNSGDAMVTGGRNVEFVFSDGVRSRVVRPN
jgi:hypothetical protein